MVYPVPHIFFQYWIQFRSVHVFPLYLFCVITLVVADFLHVERLFFFPPAIATRAETCRSVKHLWPQ